MGIETFSEAISLNAASNIGYGALPIPQPRDSEITKLLKSWLELDPPLRQVAAQKITEQQRATLIAYSERMASFAVRTHDPEKVFFGLLALGIDGWRMDWRENTLILCLHFDAVQKIGEKPDSLFEQAAEVLPLKAATALRSFLKRSPADQSLQAMGYITGSDTDGFRYMRTW